MGFLTKLRWRFSEGRGARLAKATLSPGGLVAAGGLAAIGIAVGVGLPWVIGAGAAAWLTSVVLHLRDPDLVSSLLAPQFDGDLSALDDRHMPMMAAALEARRRFEAALGELPDRSAFSGMRVRVTEALNRLYDSVVWAQRADRFLDSVDEEEIGDRLRSLPADSALSEELREQLEEVDAIRERRDQVQARISTTITGIETLGVKVGSLALGTTAPGTVISQSGEIRRMRHELDTYIDALAEVEDTLPPQPA